MELVFLLVLLLLLTTFAMPALLYMADREVPAVLERHPKLRRGWTVTRQIGQTLEKCANGVGEITKTVVQGAFTLAIFLVGVALVLLIGAAVIKWAIEELSR